MMTNTEEILKRGRDLFNRGDYKNSEQLLSEVVNVDRKSTEAFFLLGNIYHLKGEIGKAIKAFNKTLELDPAHTDASISLSVLYNDIGKYEEGKKVFEKANERIKGGMGSMGINDQHINKKFSLKHYEIADLYMSYNRFDEALFEFNKAASLDPENLEARIKVSKVYAKKGFVSKAIEELKKLLNEFPNFSDARIALGVIYYGTGKTVEAQTEWERVLGKDPKNPDAGMYLNLSRTATETTLTI